MSIDGGGIRGILPASILAELERRYLGGAPITTHFDMIAGTSTGGIVALGLAHGLRAADVLELYTQRGGTIFPAPQSGIGKALREIRQIGQSVYDRKPLEDELLRIFGRSVLGEARTRLCIPTFEGTHGEPWIYKTPHHPDYKKDRHERMVRVALATTAAPTYFDAFENDGYRMVDGGIWANNPIMNALVDAIACFEIERRQVQILSVGCGEKAFTVSDAQDPCLIVRRPVPASASPVDDLNPAHQSLRVNPTVKSRHKTILALDRQTRRSDRKTESGTGRTLTLKLPSFDGRVEHCNGVGMVTPSGYRVS